MVRIKKSNIAFFLYTFILAVISILIYDRINHLGNKNLGFSIFNCLLSSLTLIIVVSKVMDSGDKNGMSGASFLLLAASFYNQNSIYKFGVDYLFKGFITDPYGRLLGSIYIDLILIFSTYLITYLNRYRKKSNVSYVYNVSFVLVSILSLIYLFTNLIMFIRTGETLSSYSSRTMRTFDNIFKSLLYTLIGILWLKNWNAAKVKVIIPFSIVLISSILLSLLSGKKSALILPLYSIIFTLTYFGVIKKKHLMEIGGLLPLFIMTFTNITNVIGDRQQMLANTLFRLQYNGFRFDLSDFAVTIAMRFKDYAHPLRIFFEGVNIAIPKIFNSAKVDDKIYYIQQLRSMGISEASTQDFNDTVFSMGAQIAGFIGIVLIFILILLFFNYLTHLLKKIHEIGDLLIVLLIQYFSTVEGDWAMFLGNTRDVFIYILLGYLIFTIFKKVRIKNSKA